MVTFTGMSSNVQQQQQQQQQEYQRFLLGHSDSRCCLDWFAISFDINLAQYIRQERPRQTEVMSRRRLHCVTLTPQI
jgi:hypothetical protein